MLELHRVPASRPVFSWYLLCASPACHPRLACRVALAAALLNECQHGNFFTISNGDLLSLWNTKLDSDWQCLPDSGSLLLLRRCLNLNYHGNLFQHCGSDAVSHGHLHARLDSFRL